MPFDNPDEEGATKPERLLTVREVSNFLNVPKSYIYWLTHQKKIPFIKIHGILRFRKAALDQWLKAQERRGKDGDI